MGQTQILKREQQLSTKAGLTTAVNNFFLVISLHTLGVNRQSMG